MYMRDLVRAGEAAKRNELRARHRQDIGGHRKTSAKRSRSWRLERNPNFEYA
jgi:hypothetical protein